MTIKSVNLPDRRSMAVRADGEGVNIIVDGSMAGCLGITVTSDDFAREIAEANIPGLTVTYEKPVEEPAHEVDAVYRVSTEGGRRLSLAWAAHDGTWDVIDPRGDFVKAAPSILGALAANGYETSDAKFVRLIPVSDADL